ncbi:fimbrial protein [uncultured Pluralibacter sp.]|uniref:fimbrial protein n=1 Tax=uncultured Pluralibacter sp. TaxID=1490864 RepID=UPI0026349252|nr:fimbrial protein [uncultured Pluralibacter sp.]
MLEWRALLLILVFIPLLTAVASTDKISNTPGNVYLRGEIVEAACYVDPHDQSMLVEFNDISARDVSADTGKVSAHNFSIHLLGCSLGDAEHPDDIFHSASITFSGAAAPLGDEFLSVQSSDNKLENLAIEIFDRQGNIIELGKPSPDYILNPGRNTLRFTAWLIALDGHVGSGEFNAAVHFVVNYL